MAPRAVDVAPTEGRHERAREALSSFLDRTRYPPGSRPLRERPDLARPDFVPPRSLPVGATTADRRRVVLTQDRMDLAPGERALLTITCLDGGTETPCFPGEIRWSVPAPERTGTLAPLAASAAGAGWSLEVDPRALGLAGLSSPLFVQAAVQFGDEAVSAAFELTLTGQAPAHFTGEAREAREEGSIVLYVGIDVDEPGRYVVRARVDEGFGEPLAYLSETVTWSPEDTEVKLTLFGKLLRDEEARGPLVLRDVEGYRLLPDTYPDRERMPTWRGVMVRVEEVPLEKLSSAEWESPEKARMRGMLLGVVGR